MKTRLNRGWTYKRKQGRNKQEWIRVFRHEYACASQLYAYAYFKYTYTCMKHAHACTPKTLTQKTEPKKKKKGNQTA